MYILLNTNIYCEKAENLHRLNDTLTKSGQFLGKRLGLKVFSISMVI